MNFYESIRNIFIEFLFNSDTYYDSLLNSDNIQNHLITFCVDIIPFLILIAIILASLFIPFFAFYKVYTHINKELTTNVISKENPRSKRN